MIRAWQWQNKVRDKVGKAEFAPVESPSEYIYLYDNEATEQQQEKNSVFTEQLSMVWGSKLLALFACLHPPLLDHWGNMIFCEMDIRIGHVTSVANGKWI